MVENISNVLVAISALAVAVIGVVGLNQWQAQLKGTARYEVARRCLRAVLGTRDAIRRCRSPFMNGSEMAGRQRVEGEDPKVAEVCDLAYGYWNRLKEVQKEASDLEQSALEAEVLWGDQVRKSLEPLNRCIRELFASYQNHFEERLSRDPDDETLKKSRTILYSLSADKYGQDLDSAVQAAIAVFRPHLR